MIRRTGGGEYASRRRPNCSGVSGQYVRMLRSDRASAGSDGLGRAESRASRIGPHKPRREANGGAQCGVRQEDEQSSCCARDEGGPFGAALQGEASSRHELLQPKAAVVSVVEKAWQ